MPIRKQELTFVRDQRPSEVLQANMNSSGLSSMVLIWLAACGSTPVVRHEESGDPRSAITPPTAPSEASPSSPVSASALRGTVVVDEGGTLRPAPDGVLRILFRADLDWRERVVELRGGRFVVEPPAGYLWGAFGKLTLEGREAWAFHEFDARRPDSDEMHVVAHWYRPCRVQVIGENGEPLQHVVVQRERGGIMGGESYPWIDVHWMVVANPEGKAEFELPQYHDGTETFWNGHVGACNYWAQAPGYAWTPSFIDPAKDGLNVIRLARSVVLIPLRLDVKADKVGVSDDSPFPGAYLTAEARDGSSTEVPVRRERFGYWAPLAPGEWNLVLRANSDTKDGTRAPLAEMPVTLRRAEVTMIDLNQFQRFMDRAVGSPRAQ